ncbi:MAG: hypothetical protein JO104_10090 [Candidatus Eremiobacteraeota bacterium]|nr:hypothetical protein [Candidatus Eremiobacteraeota bacterium]
MEARDIGVAESGEVSLDAPETPRAHAVRCLPIAQRLDAMRETAPRHWWRNEVEAAWHDWRPALEWTLGKQGNILLGQRLVGALETAWWVLPEGAAERWLRAAFETADDMTPRNVLARLNLALGRVRLAQNRFKSCDAASQRALSFARAVSDEVGIARAELLSGHSRVVLGEWAQGERLLKAALGAFRRTEARRSTSRALVSLALAREHADDVTGAIAFCTEAVETLKAIEGESGEVDHLSYLAELEFRAGDAEKALRYVFEALDRHRRLDRRLDMIVDLSNAAAYLIALERYGDAASKARESLALAIAQNSTLWSAFAMQHLAAIAVQRGKAAASARLLGFVDARLAELGHRREHTEQQEYERAVAVLGGKLEGAELQRLMTEGRSWRQDRAAAEAAVISEPS